MPEDGVRPIPGLAGASGTPAGRLPRHRAGLRQVDGRDEGGAGRGDWGTTRRSGGIRERHPCAECRGPFAAVDAGRRDTDDRPRICRFGKDLGLRLGTLGGKYRRGPGSSAADHGRRFRPSPVGTHDGADSGIVSQPHHLANGAAFSDRGSRGRSPFKGHLDGYRRRACAGTNPAGFDRSRSGFLRRQLPQVDDGAQGGRISPCASRSSASPDPPGHFPRVAERPAEDGPFRRHGLR